MINSLVHYLRSQGIGRGYIVPIICEKLYYYVVSFIGVMKSRAAYLPVNPEFSKEHTGYMISEVNGKYILEYITEQENNQKIGRNKDIKYYELENHNYDEHIEKLNNIIECL